MASNKLNSQSLENSDLSSNMSVLLMKPDVFDGVSPHPLAWIENYNEVMFVNGWSDEKAIRYMPLFLQGSGRDWFYNEIKPSITNESTWNSVKLQFYDYYVDYKELKMRIDKIRQKDGETVSNFIPRIKKLLLSLRPPLSEIEQVEQIKNRMRPEYKQVLLVIPNINTVKDLNNYCKKIEETILKREILDNAKIIQGANSMANHEVKVIVNDTNTNKTDVEYLISKLDSINMVPRGSSPKPSTSRQSVSFIEYDVLCDGVPMQSIIDTGAGTSCIDMIIVRNLQSFITKTESDLYGATTDIKLRVIGQTNLNFVIRINSMTKRTWHTFDVVENLNSPVLVGYDLLKKLKIIVDPSTDALYFADCLKLNRD